MGVSKEQRICIKFWQKLGKTATEMYEMLQQAFGETALSHNGRRRHHFSRRKQGKSGQISRQC
jgi:hypothetical protein